MLIIFIHFYLKYFGVKYDKYYLKVYYDVLMHCITQIVF